MRVAILADDLIWSSRLADLVRGVGADASPVRTAAGLAAALPEVDRVIVDLTARGYDGIVAVSMAHEAGRPVLAIGQHDDAAARRAALAAGADRVHPYRRLHDSGPRLIREWLGVPVDEAAAGPTAGVAR